MSAGLFVAGLVIGVFAGLVGGLVILLIALLQSPKKCPDCGELLPKFRKPANRRQALWGRGTCSKCGCEMDRRGRKIEE